MKTMRFFRCLFLVCNLSIFSLFTFGQTANNNSIYYLPFNEDWHFGNFTINNWTTETSNWQIDSQIGNNAPAAKFHRTGILSDYSSSLISNNIDATTIKVGRIYLKFDLKLDDYNANGTEYFKIKIQDSTGWHTIDSINNLGSFDWETYKYDIKELTKEQTFKFAFECSGQSSLNISDWFIDNIEVYRECDAPEELWGSFYYDNLNDYGYILGWDVPQSVLIKDTLLKYCNYDNYSAVGLDCDCNYTVAIRWPAESLNKFEGDTIKSIDYYIVDKGFDNLVIKIWTGANAANLLYSDTAFAYADSMNTYNLNSNIILENDTEYWFGYELINSQAGTFQAGFDSGPAKSGLGDKISLDGISWDNLSNVGLNYNWNIIVHKSGTPEFSPTEIIGYNIFYNNEYNTEFDSLDFVYAEDTIVKYIYKKNLSAYNDSIENLDACFKVNALWGKQDDEYVSPFALTEYSIDDQLCFYITEVKENKKLMEVYPNPAIESISISCENKIDQLAVTNLNGIVLMEKNPESSGIIELNISNLPKGIYIMKAETKMGVFTKKFIKL